MKLLFIIRSLEFGGAQRQLVNVASGLHQGRHEVSVVTFYSGGALEKELLDAQVTLYSLKKRGRWDLLRPLVSLVRLIRETKPAIIYGYLPSENLVTVAAKVFCPSSRIVWGIQSSNMDLSRYDWFTRAIYHLQGYLAGFADLIIANSHAGRDYYVAQGFPDRKIKVIPNPIDAARFKPDEHAREEVRSEWRVQADQKLIGLVARLDPMKDHPTFLKAAALLAQKRKDVRFVCVGDGPAKYRDNLHTLSVELGLADRLIWASAREEIESVYNALDVVISSSAYGEGCPNVIGEAIACGVPCVATDVGDSSLIVSSAGMIVPPGDPSVLMDAMEALLTRRSLYPPALLHQQIAMSFGKKKIVSATEAQLKRILCQ